MEGSLEDCLELNLKLPEMSVALVERLVKVHKSPHKYHRSIFNSEMWLLNMAAGWTKNRQQKEEMIHCNNV